jgi:hypothetical protein
VSTALSFTSTVRTSPPATSTLSVARSKPAWVTSMRWAPGLSLMPSPLLPTTSPSTVIFAEAGVTFTVTTATRPFSLAISPTTSERRSSLSCVPPSTKNFSKAARAPT